MAIEKGHNKTIYIGTHLTLMMLESPSLERNCFLKTDVNNRGMTFIRLSSLEGGHFTN